MYPKKETKNENRKGIQEYKEMIKGINLINKSYKSYLKF